MSRTAVSAPPRRCAALWSFSSLVEAIVTAAPCPFAACPTANPMPEPPPTTNIRVPSSDMGLLRCGEALLQPVEDNSTRFRDAGFAWPFRLVREMVGIDPHELLVGGGSVRESTFRDKRQDGDVRLEVDD